MYIYINIYAHKHKSVYLSKYIHIYHNQTVTIVCGSIQVNFVTLWQRRSVVVITAAKLFRSKHGIFYTYKDQTESLALNEDCSAGS